MLLLSNEHNGGAEYIFGTTNLLAKVGQRWEAQGSGRAQEIGPVITLTRRLLAG